MKTATEILLEHGIDLMTLDDKFNTQLLAAMERYAEQKDFGDLIPKHPDTIVNFDRLELQEWMSVDNKMPEIGRQLLICDSDHRGFADYAFKAEYNGVDFMVKHFGRVRGVTYWKYQ